MGALVQATIGGIALVLWLLIFARLLLSWVDPMARTPAADFLVSMTEWILGPVRRMLPQTGMVDFSGLLVLLALGVVMRFLL
ncbi:MAG TPA: YggT family protein [Candidatus Limnocylindrales bacterium]|jgi:YggT family protein